MIEEILMEEFITGGGRHAAATMNKLFGPVIILDEVLAIGLVAFLILIPNKSGPNVLHSLFGRWASPL